MSFTLLRQVLIISLFCIAFSTHGQVKRPTSIDDSAKRNEERDRGIQLYKQNDIKGAVANLQAAVKKEKDDAEAWYYLGLALTHDNQVKQASKAYETAVKLQPNSAKSRSGLAFTLLLRNKLKEALAEAQHALAIDSSSVDGHYIVGVVRLRTGNDARALEEANAAIRLDPSFAQAYLLKSQALISALAIPPLAPDMEGREIRIVRFRDAAGALEKYLQLNPSEKEAWIDQLEALRFYVLTQTKKDLVPGLADPSEVTTKVRVLSKPEPTYTEEARHNEVVGTVVLRAVFAADGTVKHILVLKGLPGGLIQKSIAAARLIKFVPATLNGQPVSVFMQLEYNFNLY